MVEWAKLSLDMKIGCILYEYEGARGLGRNEISDYLCMRDGEVDKKLFNKSIERQLDFGVFIREWDIKTDKTGKTTAKELLLLEGAARGFYKNLVDGTKNRVGLATLDMRDYHGLSDDYESD